MATQYPPIQIVNQSDEPIGGATFDEVYKRGLLHRVVYVFCEKPDGNILLQKRSSQVATYAGCWDVSAAGHVDEGETYQQAAERELAEELGLRDLALQEVGSFYNQAVVGGRHLNRFCKVYKGAVPPTVELKPDPGEVAGIRWLDRAGIKQLITKHPDRVAIGLSSSIDHYRT